MKTIFSIHAFKRVSSRISMTHHELAKLLDNDLVVTIGDEKKSNRVHKLFYSQKDRLCFVAIQDVKTGTVITVLPIDYHHNIAWVVSIDAQVQAKKIILNRNKASQQNSQPKKKQTAKKPKKLKKAKQTQKAINNALVFRISCNMVDEYGNYKKRINLGSWPCRPYEHKVDVLVQDKTFVQTLIKRVTKKMIEGNDMTNFIQNFVIKCGCKGMPTFFLTDVIKINSG